MNKYSRLTNALYFGLILASCVCFVIDLFLPIGRANLFYLIIAIALMLIFPYLGQLFKIKISAPTLLICCFYMFTAIYLSNRYNLYKTFWFYDIVLHTLSGLILVFFFSDVFYPMDSNKEYIKTTPMVIKLAVPLLASIASAGIWEISEFFLDLITHNDVQRNLYPEHELLYSNWQNPGLLDTMNDIVNGTVGALVGTVALYLEYYKNGKKH